MSGVTRNSPVMTQQSVLSAERCWPSLCSSALRSGPYPHSSMVINGSAHARLQGLGHRTRPLPQCNSGRTQPAQVRVAVPQPPQKALPPPKVGQAALPSAVYPVVNAWFCGLCERPWLHASSRLCTLHVQPSRV